MHLFTLSLSERRALVKQTQETKDVKVFKRAQALLGLSEGLSVRAMAQRLRSSRQTIDDWVSSYQNRRHQSFLRRWQDRPKPGRSPRKSMIILRALAAWLRASPKT